MNIVLLLINAALKSKDIEIVGWKSAEVDD